MTDLQTQLDWEHLMIYRGVHRFRNMRQKALESGREDETSAGSRLMQTYVLQIGDHIQDYLDGKIPGKRRGKYAKLMGTVNTDAVAMFALRQIIGVIFMYNAEAIRKGAKQTRISLQAICGTIGGRIEDELRFSSFQTEHKEYYDAILRRLEDGGTKSYRHMHRTLVHSANSKGMEWHEWSVIDRTQVGALVVSLLLEVCDLVEIESIKDRPDRPPRKYVIPTQECVEWVTKHDGFAELIHPDRMPTLIPPADWVSPWEGGFWSPRLRHMTPLIKRATGARRERVDAAVMPRVLSAVNAMQGTPWRINGPVLAVMKEVWSKNLEIGMPRSEPYEIPPCPLAEEDSPKEWAEDDPRRIPFVEWKAEARELHSMEAERVAKNRALVRTFRLASELEDKDKFYYVYQCDFRGRLYCATTGLSPQGTDHSKAILLFGRSEPLGERGLYWLKVHGANKFGYDKCGYDQRVAWIDSEHLSWMAVASDPIGRREVWQSCDKPWQFLAWCFEYAAAMDFGPDYRSSLPVALDGSCNGLQHFSAMLRDSVGGAAVNLIGGDSPADIYRSVADVATRKLVGVRALNGDDHAAAANWLALFDKLRVGEGMDRSLSKTPVMTLPYGSTMQACTVSIFRWLHKHAPDYFDKNTNFKHSLFLSPILWASIGEVVVAAREAMSWIQKSSSIISKENAPLEYTSALGFPIYQAAYEFESKKIETQIGGRMQLRLAIDTDKIDSRKQRQGSSPNLIHSVDATHLMMVVNAAVAEDIDCFAMIHDDFGVHASRIDVWHRIIRETFVELHQSGTILKDFKELHEERLALDLPDLPPTGTLNVGEVLRSDYFFG